MSALSATPRVSGPQVDMPCHGSTAGAVGTRPLCGLSPNRPQQAAGMRIEPAPSEPIAAPARPAAIAVPEPPDEPPGVRWRSHGLRVTPNVGDSVHGVIVSSGTCVLPRITAPAERRRRTSSASAAAGPPWASLPKAVASPATSHVVLDRERDAEQRPRVARLGAPVGLVGLGQRALGEHDAVGVELRVEPRDPLEVQLGQLARRDLAAADHGGLADGSGEGEIDCVHRPGQAIRCPAMRSVVVAELSAGAPAGSRPA